MVWFMVDDKLWGHPKTLRAGNEAIGLWVRAGSYAMGYLTEGVVENDMLAMLGGTSELAQRLVDVGLWEMVDGGYAFRDWEDYQRTREQVEHDREVNRERQRRHRQRRRASANSVDNPVDNAASNDVTSEPEELVHVETPPSDELAQKRATKQSEIDEAFASWYAVYPRKQGKADARKAFGQLYTKRALPPLDELIARTKRYAAQQVDPTYTKLPAGWLRSGRFDDDDLAPQQQTQTKSDLAVWLEARGSSLDEYERMKNTPGWLEQLKQKGNR